MSDSSERIVLNEVTGYRPEIDGLRAVAVIAVLFFHAGVPGFSGGFAGVDVFFVISGYLITSIIARELEAGTFSLSRFYVRRIRRILPAFFVVIIATTCVASLFFLPDDFYSLGMSIVAATTFSSNLLFWRQDDYFDAPAELKPLLHTWSLSVEEQFYIVFPFLLIALWQLTPRDRQRAMAYVALLSFALGVWATSKLPQAAFYLLPTRTWELLIGSFLALGGPSKNRLPARTVWISSWVGLLLVLVSNVAMDESTPFPGVAALLPTGGAALLLWAGSRERTGASVLLAFQPLVLVGKLSFSLYLWHWPVIVLIRYALARDLEQAEIVFVIVVSFGLAFLSWQFVEKPFRRSSLVSSRVVFASAATAIAGILVAGVGIVASGGMPQRLPDDLLAYADAEHARAEDGRVPCTEWAEYRTTLSVVCLVGDPSAARPSFAVIGDSHAEALLPAFDLAATRRGKKGLVFIRHACRPALGVGHTIDGKRDRSCAKFVRQAIAEIRAQTSIREVVFAARWSRQVLGTGYQQSRSYYTDAVSSEVSTLENKLSLIRGLARSFSALAGRRITVVSAVPENEFMTPVALAMADLFDRPPPRTSASAFQRRDAPVREVFAELAKSYSFNVISPAAQMCDERSCRAQVGGRPLYRDDDHLSEFGAKQLVQLIGGMFEDDQVVEPDVRGASGVDVP